MEYNYRYVKIEDKAGSNSRDNPGWAGVGE